MPDIKILNRDVLTGRLSVGLTVPPEYVEGIDLLVQIVALTYLNNGGRSIVTPDRAGGLREFIGSNINPDDPSELFADLRLITSQIEQLIKQEQVLTARPPSERLLRLQLIDIIPNEDDLSVEVIVAVVNEEQQQAQAVVVS